jgi:molybdopterin molybdotransferase
MNSLMISFDEAYSIVMNSVFETQSEVVPFNNTVGRILDEDIFSDIDMPPFNRSAMDGYACHKNDLNADLEIIEIVAAGKAPLHTVGKNQCSKIMTGAIVPQGCDVVFMVEESEKLANGKIRFTGIGPKKNISYKGEDVKKGDVVIRKSRLIQPQDIAIMASVGHINVKVRIRPTVGIISTGDELVNPADIPGISQIRNSNAYQLSAQVKRAGGEAVDYGIAPDNESVTFDKIKNAIDKNDIVIITGGVSMGDFDFVPAVLERAGVKIMFDQVNVQPGKPTTFGVHTKTVIFGLPGNPVSSFMQFELLVRPLINRMMGYAWAPFEYMLPMAVDYMRKSSSRLGFIPVSINEKKEVIPVDFHGSAHLTALSGAEGIIALKPGITSLNKGEIVNVRQI